MTEEKGDNQKIVEELISGLKQQKDELALKIHLGKEDAKDEWDKVQDKFAKMMEEWEPVKDAVEESAGNVFESLKLVAGEIKESFGRIKDTVVEEDA